METLTLTTPSILFSAVSLILLAYTNRFLAYAQVVRNLKAEHEKNLSAITQKQLDNLRKRLYLCRSMQIFGVSSLLLCVLCTFLIYIGMQMPAVWTFGVALVLLVISLCISMREVQISVKSLELRLGDMTSKAAGPHPQSGRGGRGSHKASPAGSPEGSPAAAGRSRRSRGSGRSRTASESAPAATGIAALPRPSDHPATYTDPNTLGTTSATAARVNNSPNPERPPQQGGSSGGARRGGGRPRGGSAKQSGGNE